MPASNDPRPEPAEDPAVDPTAAITDADLRALLLQARQGDDERLRRLVTNYVTLRAVMADVLAFVEAREGGAAVAGTPLLLRARRLTDAPRR